MPKHVILFAAFLALLTAILYHPIPDPDLWAPESPAWTGPDHSLEKQDHELPNWEQKLDHHALTSVR